MHGMWRFYVDECARWRWQRVSANRVMVAESTVGFADYEQCVNDAHSKGYLVQAAEAKLKPTRGERSLVGTSYNVRLATAENAGADDVRPASESPALL